MRSDVVVVVAPASAQLRRASKIVVNECKLRSSSRILPLSDSMFAFCVGLPGSMKCRLNPALSAPAQHRQARELRAVVEANRFGRPRSKAMSLEFPDNVGASERIRDAQCEAFAGEIVDDL